MNQEKLQQIQDHLKQTNTQAAILLHPDPNITYLTQKNLSHAVLIITNQDATLLITKLDKINNINTNIKIKEYNKDWQKTHLSNITNIAINKNSLTLTQKESLDKDNNKTITDISELLADLRLTKTNKEIQLMQKAATIADNALKDLITTINQNGIKQFKTELDIAIFLETKIRQQGAQLSFPTIVANNENSAVPHHITSTKVLETGFLLIDFGAKYQNYCSDMTRMFYIGTPTPEHKQIYNKLLETQEACIKAAKPNQKCQELDTLARQLLKEDEKFFIHSLGHGIGTQVHEKPRLSKQSQDTIKLNMPFTIEPGLYYKNKFGLRIEDTCIIQKDNKNQVKRLTNSPKELILLN